MTQPIIGITTYNGQTKEDLPAIIVLRVYVQAIIDAGGVPMLIPAELDKDDWMDIFERMDGFLLSGGGDIALERLTVYPIPASMVLTRHVMNSN